MSKPKQDAPSEQSLQTLSNYKKPIVRHFLNIQLNRNFSEFTRVYVFTKRTNLWGSVVTGYSYRQSKEVWFDNSVQFSGEPELAPADFSKWLCSDFASFVHAEYANLTEAYNQLRKLAQTKPRSSTWGNYRELAEKTFRASRQKKDLVHLDRYCSALLSYRAQLLQARVLPFDKELSRATKRRLKRKAKFRSGNSYTRYPVQPENIKNRGAFSVKIVKPQKKKKKISESKGQDKPYEGNVYFSDIFDSPDWSSTG